MSETVPRNVGNSSSTPGSWGIMVWSTWSSCGLHSRLGTAGEMSSATLFAFKNLLLEEATVAEFMQLFQRNWELSRDWVRTSYTNKSMQNIEDSESGQNPAPPWSESSSTLVRIQLHPGQNPAPPWSESSSTLVRIQLHPGQNPAPPC